VSPSQRSATAEAAPPAISIRDIGSFHVGGRRVTITGLPARDLYYSDTVATPVPLAVSGDYYVEQMYVQYIALARARARYPLWMIHGGRGTGVSWETTPDSRPGFQMLFLRHGHDVYISDAVERGRASWASPLIWTSEPFFPAAEGTWDIGRIGPPGSYRSEAEARRPYAGSQFPVAAFDAFMKQRVPRWTTNGAATQAAYDLCLQRIGPCVLIAHSTGGPFAIRMALHHPGLVKGLVLIEPAGAPNPASEPARSLRNIPHLYVWGDNRSDEPSMKNTIPLAKTWCAALQDAGTTVDWLDLPAIGITGNSHFIPMDLNNEKVADLIQDWMVRNDMVSGS